MLQASDMSWQHQPFSSPIDRLESSHYPIDNPEFLPPSSLGDWDLSELFQSALDPRAMSGGFNSSQPFAEADLDHAINALRASTSNPATFFEPSSSLSIRYSATGQDRMDFADHSYDIFSSPSSLNTRYLTDSSPSSFQPSPALSSKSFAPAQEMYYQARAQSSSFPASPASSNAFELMAGLSALGSVPEDAISPAPQHSPALYNGLQSPGTVSPTAVNKVSESFAPEPSFAELMMGRQSPVPGYPENLIMSSPNNPLHQQIPSQFPTFPAEASSSRVSRHYDTSSHHVNNALHYPQGTSSSPVSLTSPGHDGNGLHKFIR